MPAVYSANCSVMTKRCPTNVFKTDPKAVLSNYLLKVPAYVDVESFYRIALCYFGRFRKENFGLPGVRCSSSLGSSVGNTLVFKK